MGELELREVRLNDTIDPLSQKTIDQYSVEILEAEIDELHSDMLDLEGRLDGLRTTLVMASRLSSERSAAST